MAITFYFSTHTDLTHVSCGAAHFTPTFNVKVTFEDQSLLYRKFCFIDWLPLGAFAFYKRILFSFFCDAKSNIQITFIHKLEKRQHSLNIKKVGPKLGPCGTPLGILKYATVVLLLCKFRRGDLLFVCLQKAYRYIINRSYTNSRVRLKHMDSTGNICLS